MRFSISAFVLLILISSCGVEKKAQRAYLLGKYQSTIDLYQKVLSSNPNNGKANYFVAESYRLSNRVKQAEPFYAKAGGKGIDSDSVQFYYAQSLKANSKYAEAEKVLNKLISETDNPALKERASAEVSGLQYLSELDQKENFYRVKNLESVNSPASEYSPVFHNNELYFTTSRGNEKIYEATGTPFTNIYKVASRGANVEINTLAPLPEGINTTGVNDGCVTFSPDGRIMIFAKGNTRKRKGVNPTEDVDLFISRFRNGTWSEPVPVPGLNDPNAWDSSPCFAPDGRTLYFASNRRGRGKESSGYGGTDIYSAVMDSRGRFSRVRNLGPQINTAGNELFPYIADDGRLYFASDGHPGYGGLDLFVYRRVGGKTTIENLGQPMNSPADDFGIFLFRPDRGFFTSNREGGKGDDDIYTFVNEDPDLRVINYYLQGITYTKGDNDALQVLPNTRVSLLDGNGELMQDYVTGNDGKFLFRVYENEVYSLVGETDGFLVERIDYTTVGKSVDPRSVKDLITNVTLDTLLVLDKMELNKIFLLENIYYKFNQWDIQPSAAKELDKLVQLLVDNPEIKIELASHTDSIDDNDYNMRLSQRRAESAVQYLVQRGISPDRLIAKGYGEERPIARNTNPDGTDNPEGRQKNRRTEFKILEIGSKPKPIEDDETFDEDKYFRGE